MQRQTSVKACFKRAIRILKDGVVNEVYQFSVLFEDGTRKWRKRSQTCDGLLTEYQQNRTKPYRGSRMLLRK